MSTVYKLSSDVTVTRWWSRGSFRWTLHSDTLDVGQIAELASLVDPTVFKALYETAVKYHCFECGADTDEVNGCPHK